MNKKISIAVSLAALLLLTSADAGQSRISEKRGDSTYLKRQQEDTVSLSDYLEEVSINPYVHVLSGAAHEVIKADQKLQKIIDSLSYDAPQGIRRGDWITQFFGQSFEELLKQFENVPAPFTWSLREIDEDYNEIAHAKRKGNMETKIYLVEDVHISGINRTPSGKDAIVQVPSQFNFLPAPGNEIVPVNKYNSYMEQGTLGAVEAAAASIHRYEAVTSDKLPHALSNIFGSRLKSANFSLKSLDESTMEKIATILREKIGDLRILPTWVMCEISGTEQLQVLTPMPQFSEKPSEQEINFASLLIVPQYAALAKIAVIKSYSEFEGTVNLHLTTFKVPDALMKMALEKVYAIIKGFPIKVFIHAVDEKEAAKLSHTLNQLEGVKIQKITHDEFETFGGDKPQAAPHDQKSEKSEDAEEEKDSGDLSDELKGGSLKGKEEKAPPPPPRESTKHEAEKKKEETPPPPTSEDTDDLTPPDIGDMKQGSKAPPPPPPPPPTNQKQLTKNKEESSKEEKKLDEEKPPVEEKKSTGGGSLMEEIQRKAAQKQKERQEGKTEHTKEEKVPPPPPPREATKHEPEKQKEETPPPSEDDAGDLPPPPNIGDMDKPKGKTEESKAPPPPPPMPKSHLTQKKDDTSKKEKKLDEEKQPVEEEQTEAGNSLADQLKEALAKKKGKTEQKKDVTKEEKAPPPPPREEKRHEAEKKKEETPPPPPLEDTGDLPPPDIGDMKKTKEETPPSEEKGSGQTKKPMNLLDQIKEGKQLKKTGGIEKLEKEAEGKRKNPSATGSSSEGDLGNLLQNALANRLKSMKGGEEEDDDTKDDEEWEN